MDKKNRLLSLGAMHCFTIVINFEYTLTRGLSKSKHGAVAVTVAMWRKPGKKKTEFEQRDFPDKSASHFISTFPIPKPSLLYQSASFISRVHFWPFYSVFEYQLASLKRVFSSGSGAWVLQAWLRAITVVGCKGCGGAGHDWDSHGTQNDPVYAYRRFINPSAIS